MVLVSHRFRFIYLKTHKTASTSVEAALEHACRPAGQGPLPPDHYRSAEVSDAGIIGSRGPVRSAQDRIWRNHMGAGAVARHLGPVRFLRYARIAVVRNPYDRAVSMFYHRLGRAGQARIAEQPFDVARKRFSDWVQTADLNQNATKLRLFGLPCLTHVIRYESLETSLARVSDALGLPPGPPLPRFKSNRRGHARPYTDYYTDAARAAVARANAYELRAFGYGFGDAAGGGRPGKGAGKSG